MPRTLAYTGRSGLMSDSATTRGRARESIRGGAGGAGGAEPFLPATQPPGGERELAEEAGALAPAPPDGERVDAVVRRPRRRQRRPPRARRLGHRLGQLEEAPDAGRQPALVHRDPARPAEGAHLRQKSDQGAVPAPELARVEGKRPRGAGVNLPLDGCQRRGPRLAAPAPPPPDDERTIAP